MTKFKKHTAPGPRRRGAIVVMLLLLLPVLLILLGFSVDMAHMLRVKAQMKAATDLAAKSGANVLSQSQDTNEAIQAIIEVAEANEVAGEGLTIDAADIVFGRSIKQPDGSYTFVPGATPTNAVQVTGRRGDGTPDGPVNMFFSNFMGANSFKPTSTSSATFKDVDICLVLDRSSSMKLATTSTANGMNTGSDPRACQAPWADSRWVAMADSVADFANSINSTIAAEQVAMVTFASNYTSPCGETSTVADLDQDLTTNMALVTNAINAKSAAVWNGGTDINAGMTLANNVLTGPSSRSTAERIMIVFTDGAYTGSDPMLAADISLANDIRVFTITYGAGANTTDMANISAHTDGYHYHAPDAAALQTAFDEIRAVVEFLTQ